MKAIAIVELPDDAFDKGRWYLSNIYYTERKSLFDIFANDMWELKPLPEKKPVSYHDDLYGDVEKNYTNIGWNDCLKEILNESSTCN